MGCSLILKSSFDFILDEVQVQQLTTEQQRSGVDMCVTYA